MRTLEDTLPELVGAKVFSKLDLRSGYWTIPLSEESSYFTTFYTLFGRYRFLRLPFGLKSSHDKFQRKVDQCFEHLPGVVALVDDILVYGRSHSEHDKALRKVLVKARETGLKFNRDKLQVAVDRVKYFGHILTSSGIEPEPEKITVIQDMIPLTYSKSMLLNMVLAQQSCRKASPLFTSPSRSRRCEM